MAIYYVSATASGGGNGSIGNPWTLAEAISGAANGDEVNVQQGVYTSNVAITQPAGTLFRGYAVTPGDEGQFTLQMTSSLSGGYAWTLGGSLRALENVILTSSATPSPRGIRLTGDSRLSNCHVLDWTEFDAISNSGTGTLDKCLLDSTKSGSEQAASRSLSKCSQRRFGANEHGLDRCVAVAKSGAIQDSFVVTFRSDAVNCVSINSPGRGFFAQFPANQMFRDCISINDSIAFASGSANVIVRCVNCFQFGATTVSQNIINPDITTLAADPFVDSANLDLRLTNQAKASVYGQRLKAIMVNLVEVPGIVTDSLSELLSGSAGFTGIRGTSRRLGA